MKVTIGIIAEDDSDIDVLKAIIKKIAKRQVVVHKFIGKGCGKIIGKCRAWAEDLKRRGCDSLILVHDLDEKDKDALTRTLEKALSPCPFDLHVIVIAVREVEAWLLADHEAIRTSLGIKASVKKVPNPETIFRPKEYLRDLIDTKSKHSIYYVNTIHNKRIAKSVSVKSMERCPSFLPLVNFLRTHC